ncbi:P-loop containing nucleoside triphosphate hydrolase protein [Trametes cingulata]|nr:P-loop containing nucleoside triphosphate hydrolase protein [Trametes cingulata]
MREAFRWDADPKDFQLAAVQAQIEGVDMIVQAPTGSGKTALAAGPHLWPGNENKFTLMVCPLLSLEEEMVHTFDTEFGLKAIALNSSNGACSPLVIRDILDLKYQILLVSPEMLQSCTFMDRVLRNSSFMQNIISMFIDEAHCIAHWGADFRKKYGSLGKVRTFLPRGTPVIAVTATLTARVRRTIHHVLHFGQSDAQSRFINKGNDRPNVSIVVRACEHPLNSYADLDFIIPTSLRSPTDIPKTYIYVDNISVGGEIIDYLDDKIASRRVRAPTDGGSRSTTVEPVPDGLVRPFNATFSQDYRSLAMAHFRLGSIRILVCTDAAGMGCNLPDIDRVVQWKLPATFSNFIQRAGRAARGRDRTGLAILLVEKSAYNTDLVSGKGDSTKDLKRRKGSALKPSSATAANALSEGGKKDPQETREYAKAHGASRGGSKREDALPTGAQPILDPEVSDEGLLAFVQSTSCRRRLWAQAFESELTLPPAVACCDICSPLLLDHARPAMARAEKKAKQVKRGLPDTNAQRGLKEWLRAVFVRDHRRAQYDETAILEDELISLLSACGPLSHECLASVLKEKWSFWDEYNEELETFLNTLAVVFTPIPAKPRAPRAPRSLPLPSLPDSQAPSATEPLAAFPPLRASPSTPSESLVPRPTAFSSLPQSRLFVMPSQDILPMRTQVPPSHPAVVSMPLTPSVTARRTSTPMPSSLSTTRSAVANSSHTAWYYSQLSSLNASQVLGKRPYPELENSYRADPGQAMSVPHEPKRQRRVQTADYATGLVDRIGYPRTNTPRMASHVTGQSIPACPPATPTPLRQTQSGQDFTALPPLGGRIATPSRPSPVPSSGPYRSGYVPGSGVESSLAPSRSTAAWSGSQSTNQYYPATVPSPSPLHAAVQLSRSQTAGDVYYHPHTPTHPVPGPSQPPLGSLQHRQHDVRELEARRVYYNQSAHDWPQTSAPSSSGQVNYALGVFGSPYTHPSRSHHLSATAAGDHRRPPDFRLPRDGSTREHAAPSSRTLPTRI